jgi:hypothetical protein
VWGPEKARRILDLLEGRDAAAAADAPGPAAAAAAAGADAASCSASAPPPPPPARRRRRALVFCYSNRLEQIGAVPGAEQWCDYTVVPLLEVPEPGPGAAAAAWLASPRSAGHDVVGSAEAALASEAPAEARARWADLPAELLARGWYAQ